jgi:hypothetical protein
MTTKTAYTAVSPTGERVTRKSGRTYTHAAFANMPEKFHNSGWIFIGFSGSAELASKNARTWVGYGATDTSVVHVAVEG